MAGVVQNWSTRNLDTKQKDYGNPHKEYIAIRYGNVKIHLHDKKSILKCLFLLLLYIMLLSTHVHMHTLMNITMLWVFLTNSFLLCLLHCHFHGFLWNFFTSRNSMTSKSQMWKHIFQPLLKESQQSPSPQERFKKPADPDVCLLLGPSYLHHPFSTLKSAVFHCNRPCKYQWLPHLQTPVLEKLNHFLPHPPGACISAYEGWEKWGIPWSSG